MDADLPGTLRELLRSGTTSNPALNTLLDDYTKYHVALIAVGGIFLVGLVLLAILFWTRFARARREGPRKWTFESKTYFGFGVLAIVVALFLGLVLAANVSTVRNPRQGFVGSISLLNQSPSEGSRTAELYAAVASGLRSGSAEIPTALQERVDDRLSWQRPKAVICSILLIGFVFATAFVWRSLIRRSRSRVGRWKMQDAGLLLLGGVLVVACLLLMLMVMGNVQGSIAPVSLTLFFS